MIQRTRCHIHPLYDFYQRIGRFYAPLFLSRSFEFVAECNQNDNSFGRMTNKLSIAVCAVIILSSVRYQTVYIFHCPPESSYSWRFADDDLIQNKNEYVAELKYVYVHNGYTTSAV